jgi:ABC-2 type transport system ATP-binding protein
VLTRGGRPPEPPDAALRAAHGQEALPGLLRSLDAAGLSLQSIQLACPSLDDVFLTVTGRSLREDAPDTAPAARVPVA